MQAAQPAGTEHQTGRIGLVVGPRFNLLAVAERDADVLDSEPRSSICRMACTLKLSRAMGTSDDFARSSPLQVYGKANVSSSYDTIPPMESTPSPFDPVPHCLQLPSTSEDI